LKLLATRVRHPAASQMRRSAIVFSPHYDDETLGVGGTIIQKRQSGAIVHLVFMTDGSRSHAMEGQRLSEIRKQEALKAAAALGVSPSDITFLEYPEKRLARHRAEAIDRVVALLQSFKYEEVYVPSTLEPLLWSADHNVTTDVVFTAIARVGQHPEVFEYLVWFWYHWPWVPLHRGLELRRLLALTWANRFGMAACDGLNTAVRIADVLAQKRLALDQYASQMTRLAKDRPWPVLADVGQGEFVERFFQPNEFFRHYRYAGVSKGNQS
jgi:LmbE family N-acetylglucosaminyl deacetylase